MPPKKVATKAATKVAASPFSYPSFPMFYVPPEDPLSEEEQDEPVVAEESAEDLRAEIANQKVTIANIQSQLEVMCQFMQNMQMHMEATAQPSPPAPPVVPAVVTKPPVVMKTEPLPISAPFQATFAGFGKPEAKLPATMPGFGTPQGKAVQPSFAGFGTPPSKVSVSTNPLNGTPMSLNHNVTPNKTGATYTTPDFDALGYPSNHEGHMVVGSTMQRIYKGAKGGTYYYTPSKVGTGLTMKYLTADQRAVFNTLYNAPV